MQKIKLLVIPVVKYNFDIINWMLTEIKKMDTKVRKLKTCHRIHHPIADTECLYVRRENGGRCLIQKELTYKITTIRLKKYLDTTTDWMIQLVDTHEKQRKKKFNQ